MISQGCKFCYLEVMARRLKVMVLEKYRIGFVWSVGDSRARLLVKHLVTFNISGQ